MRRRDTCSASVSTTTTAIIVTEWAIPCFMSCSSRPRNDIVAFYSWGDLSKLMILSVEYADSAPVSVQKEALKIAGYMTPDSDVYLEDVDANPWNPQIREFPPERGAFGTWDRNILTTQKCRPVFSTSRGDDYPELIITNGAADGQSSRAYIYTFSENWQVEYLRTATTEDLNAMPLQPFTAIRGGWGDFLKACGLCQIEYLSAQNKLSGLARHLPIRRWRSGRAVYRQGVRRQRGARRLCVPQSGRRI